MSALAAAAAYTARTEAILTHRALDVARAQAAADAGIVDAISNLSDEQVGRHPPIGGQSRQWEFDGMPVVVEVHNEAARIDINGATDALLQAFLQAEGVDRENASTMLDQLRDWQDPDDIARGHGAEIADYRQRGLHVSPRNGPLQSVEELRQIPAWAAQNLDCWMSSLTVYTGQQSVEESDANAQVLAALGRMRTYPGGAAAPPAPLLSTIRSAAPSSLVGRVLRIRASATVSPGITASREWIGRLTGDRKSPTLTMSWQLHSNGAPADCGTPGQP